MTTSSQPLDFAVGLAPEQRRISSALSDGYGLAVVGHAVPPAGVRDGEGASRAVCGKQTTVEEPDKRYWPEGGADYMDCHRCGEHVRRTRGRG